MRVVSLAAGAGGMLCGSCMRDNRLAATLIEQGRDVALVPLYTPLRTDEQDASTGPVFFGGINVYLQQSSALFRHTPGWLDRLLDAPSLLEIAGRRAGAVRPAELGPLTVAVLEGADGPLVKEVDRLVDGLRAHEPDLVNLPDLMFIALAERLRAALGCAVVCTLSGEDLFVDQLPEPHRSRVFELIARHASSVDAYVSLSRYYADHAARHFRIPAERIHVVPAGIRVEDFVQADGAGRLFTIGYLARIAPEKGLHVLAKSFAQLRAAGRSCRLVAGGWLGAADRGYLEEVRASLRKAGCLEAFEYRGEVTREGKARMLAECHAFSVPAVHPEAKGLYVLEAQAAGVPVVLPRHGSFVELVEATGGGLLYDASDDQGLTDHLAALMDDEPKRRALGERGRAAAMEKFNDRVMADGTWALYERVVAARGTR